MSEVFSSGNDKIVGVEYTYINSNGEKVLMTPSIFVYDSNSNLPNLVADKLLYDDYYVNQLTLLLQKSYGIPQQISIYTEVLRLFNAIELDLFNTLGTYASLDENGNEKDWLLNIKKINSFSTTESDLLDKLAVIYNVQRHYYLKDFANDKNGNTYISITLSNTELYMIIYASIIRNNFDGTNLQANELYNKLNLIASTAGLSAFQINMITNTNDYDSCYVFLNANGLYQSNGTIKDEYVNLVNLFYNGYFDIKSMGITYKHLNIEYGKAGYFNGVITGVESDGTLTTSEIKEHCYWDVCYWSE